MLIIYFAIFTITSIFSTEIEAFGKFSIQRPSQLYSVAISHLSNLNGIRETYLKDAFVNFRKVVASTSIFATSFLPVNIRKVSDVAQIQNKQVPPNPRLGGNSRKENFIGDPRKGSKGPFRNRFSGSGGLNGDSMSPTNREFAPIRSVAGGTSFVRDAVKAVGASVVRIDCEREVHQIINIFSDTLRETDVVKVSGSGIVVSSDGYILTNAHVIQDSRRITITLSSGRSFKAKVVAFDELTDLAVMKAELPSDIHLKSAPLGDSSALQSGDWVIAVGCPVGLDFTVTLGIVSNPKRSSVEVGAPHLKGHYIQTDAALNSGNSGGPLVNEAGQVIGINTMVRTNTEAIGFAIPINRVGEIYNVLKQGKKPSHAYFGIEVMSLTPDFARIHNDDPNAQRLPEIHGALVLRVLPGSPAAIGGLRKYDIITEVNGRTIASSEIAETVLDECKPGVNGRIKIARGEQGNSLDLEASPQDLLTILEERRRGRQLPQQQRP